MKKFLFVFLVFLGCQGGDAPRSGIKELRINSHAEPPTLDPRRATDNISCNILKMCFEGLTALNTNGQAELAAAEKVENTDLEYTFTLRNTKWSDGRPVTAFDFEKTWQTMLEPTFPCHFAIDLYIIKNAQAAKEGKCPVSEVGIKALDEKTLKITLEHPAPYLLNLLASHSFLPIANHVNDKQIPFVSNGPFKLTHWDHYQEIIADKNSLYWDSKNVKLDRVRVSIVEDENTEFSMFENDEIDWAGNPFSTLPLDALATLRKKYDLVTLPLAGVYNYVFNVEAFPFNNVNIRKAFSLAINRKAIIDNILQGEQKIATSYIPPMTQYQPDSFFKDNDTEEANRLFNLGLEELKIKKEDFPEITLSYNTADGHHKIAQAIQEHWTAVFGIKVQLENREWKVFLDTLNKKQFQVARMGSLASFNDPITFLDGYKYPDSSNNHTGWTHPDFTRFLEEAENCTDQAKRIELLKKAEKVLIDEMPIAPIYFYTQSYIKKPYVVGGELSEIGDMDIKTVELK